MHTPLHACSVHAEGDDYSHGLQYLRMYILDVSHIALPQSVRRSTYAVCRVQGTVVAEPV